MKTSWFITFEGGEGAGKSTQIAALAARMRDAGMEIVTTREPGGSPDADALRELLVTGEPGRWSPAGEALLNYAARESHLNHTIRPALMAGCSVLCDRFADSTRAYQGIAGGLGLDLVEQLDRAIVGDTQPDITLVFDLDPEVGLERARQRGGEDRFERKGLEFHRKLREAFRQIAAEHANRCYLVDASASVNDVSEQIWKAVSSRLALSTP
jgi:dTMP kinase